MGLSCGWDGGDYDWYFEPPDDFSKLATKRGRRCCSCKKLIKLGDDCLKFGRWRHPKTDIEDRIYGEGGEIRIADKYMCEECGGLYLALDELGYCITICGESSMQELVRQHNEIQQERQDERKHQVREVNDPTQARGERLAEGAARAGGDAGL